MTSRVPQTVTDAVALLRRHAAVLHVESPVPTAAGGFRVEATIAVELPSRAKPDAISASGVKSQELVVLDFGPDWPTSAPSIGLRKDFPRHFPHVNPYTPGDCVRPCIYYGSVTELMHREGLDQVIDQVVDWLCKAAADNLVNPLQGWEPTRRDELAGKAVFDAERMLELLQPDGKPIRLPTAFVGFNEHRRFAIGRHSDERRNSWFAYDERTDKIGRWFDGTTCAFLAGPLHVGGAAPVADVYEPETVRSLAELGEKADRLGIDGSGLLSVVEEFFVGSQKAGKTFGWMGEFFAVVILAAYRPLPIISAFGRRVELLPYVVRYSPLRTTRFATHATVEPLFHIQSLTPQVLRAVSGTTAAETARPMVFLGCGSLGSKVALHLARAGFGNQTFVDKDEFAPHNLARHALLERPEGRIWPLKSLLMRSAVQELGHAPPQAQYEDAVDVLQQPKLFGQVVTANASLIVDATASLRVAEAACSSTPLDTFEGRYARMAMVGQGGACYVALEGPGRSVRIDDLLAVLYARCRNDVTQRLRMAGKNVGSERVFVGQNCSSATTIMTDSVVSRSAALAATQLERWLQHGYPARGALAIGIEDASGVGMQWTTQLQEATMVLKVESDGGWEVRVLANVVSSITADAKKWKLSETGGALVGHVYPGRRCIVVGDVVDAPPDSIRSPGKFVLGVEGLEDAVRGVHRDTLGHLHLVGTWHSHPGGGPLSPTDLSTLKKIAKDGRGLPVISLVWTPNGFRCEVQTLH